MAKAKKKRSQAPVALVYFTTLMVFMAIFGYVAYHLVKKLSVTREKEDSSEVYVDKSFSVLFARTNRMGSLADSAVVKFIPEENRVIVVPLPAQTVSQSTGSVMKDIFAANGGKSLKSSVEKTLDITIDYYSIVSESSFENVYDLIGGVIFTPQEELYRLSENNDQDDISYRAGVPVSISGKQAITLLAADVFSGGREDNLDLLGSVLKQLINNAFQQPSATRNSLDNFYTKLVSDGESDYLSSKFREDKENILEMLDKNLKPVLLKVPDGVWEGTSKFTIASTFKNELLEVYGFRSLPSTNMAVSTDESIE